MGSCDENTIPVSKLLDLKKHLKKPKKGSKFWKNFFGGKVLINSVVEA
jgi:hypothetical protein